MQAFVSQRREVALDIDFWYFQNRGGGGEFKIIAAILERPLIENILEHLGRNHSGRLWPWLAS